MTPKKIQIAIEKLCFPLKIFKINPRNVGIMVSISIAFIPIMQREMQNLKYSLNAKGFKFDLRNILGKPSVILLPLIVSILKKTDEIFVTVSFIFIMTILMRIYWSSTNYQVTALQAQQAIKEIYERDVADIDRIHDELAGAESGE